MEFERHVCRASGVSQNKQDKWFQHLENLVMVRSPEKTEIPTREMEKTTWHIIQRMQKSVTQCSYRQHVFQKLKTASHTCMQNLDLAGIVSEIFGSVQDIACRITDLAGSVVDTTCRIVDNITSASQMSQVGMGRDVALSMLLGLKDLPICVT